MTQGTDRITPALQGKVVISIDAMGGDLGVSEVIKGMAASVAENPGVGYIVHGNAEQINKLLAKRPELAAVTDVRHAEGVVSMRDKPSKVVRNGKGTSMWSALQSVADGEATVAVSCGNTGALMALSMLRLRKAPGVNRPAIAVLWPSHNPQGYNVMLDVGADIRADAQDLFQYALMGASYARNGFNLQRPRVGLLNVGTEEHKGRHELHEAAALLEQAQEQHGFEYVGFVEGSDLPSTRVDIIVTDGFTGNIALKTGEGTAKLIRGFLKDAFTHTLLARIAAIFAMTSLRRLQQRIDPRRVNGGVFLGLNGTVVKSHGGADSTGVAAAIRLAFRLAENGFSEKLAARVASSLAVGNNTDTQEKEADE